MKSHLPITLGLALLLAGVAQAQEHQYQVSGDGVSGTATVTRHRFSKGAVKVKLRFEAIRGAKQKETRAVDVWGHQSPAGLSFSYTHQVTRKRGLLAGAAAWLKDPLGPLNGRSPRRYTETVRVNVRLKPAGKGRLQGAVEGVQQTWIPTGAMDDVVVLVIPGLSTNSWNRFGVPYLDENVAALEARGLEAYRVGIVTEQSVKTNAAFIAREVRKNVKLGKRVVIMAHSKGATDATAALAIYPDLRQHVIGLIGIQPVYGGSPIADLGNSNGVLKGMIKIMFEKVFKGSRDAVIDLTHARRADFVKKHPYPADQIPTVVVQSTFDRGFGSKSVLWGFQKLIEKRNHSPSDGMVMPQDQLIPGAKRVLTYADLDHFEPGVRVESPHSPTKITNEALDALLPYLTKKALPAAGAK